MSSTVLDATANGRLLACIRIAVGVTAAVRGVVLLFLGADLLLALPWLALSVAVVLGWRAREAAAALVLLGVLLASEGYYKNHVYLMWLCLLLVAVSDCQRHYALRPRGSGPVPGWPLMLMRYQLSIVYIFAGIAKLNADFLSGDVLAHYFERAFLPLPDQQVLLVSLAVATVGLELFAGVAVWSRRLRPAVFALALPLHAGMLTVTYNLEDGSGIAIFAVLMFVLLATFLDVPERGRTLTANAMCPHCRRWTSIVRRTDAFGALRVSVESDAAHRGAMHLVEPDERTRNGFDALRGSLAVTPSGFLVAPGLALPGMRHAGEELHRRRCRCVATVPSADRWTETEREERAAR